MHQPDYCSLSRDLNYISFLSDIRDQRKQLFINEVHKVMINVTYPAMAPITSIGDRADRMFFVQCGSVNVSLEDGSILSTLHKGEGFGEISLLGCTEWHLGGHHVQYISTGFTMLTYVTAHDFMSIVRNFGGEIEQCIEAKRGEFRRKNQERVNRLPSSEGSDESVENTVVLIRWFELKKRLLDVDRRLAREQQHEDDSPLGSMMDKLSGSVLKQGLQTKLIAMSESTAPGFNGSSRTPPMSIRRKLSTVNSASSRSQPSDLDSLAKKVEEMSLLLQVRRSSSILFQMSCSMNLFHSSPFQMSSSMQPLRRAGILSMLHTRCSLHILQ